MADERRIELSGGKIYLTDNPRQSFEVVQGSVLIYLVPLTEDGDVGRRIFFYEAAPGERIPSFCCATIGKKEDSKKLRWRFALMALTRAELSVLDECSPGLRQRYIEIAGIGKAEELSFNECMIEVYRLSETKDLRDIYAATSEQEKVYSGGLRIIGDFFKSKRLRQTREATGSVLYDAMAHICDKRHMSISSYEEVRSVCGRQYTAADVARMSHFICRDVVLAEKWYKSDTGAVLAYYGSIRHPVACLPKGAGGYVAYDPADESVRKIDAAYAAELLPSAQMLYRPFPNKVINKGRLLRFGLRDVHKSDILVMILLAFLGALVALLIPYMNEQLYDSFIPTGNTSGLIGACVVVLACMLGSLSFTIVKNLAVFRSMSSMKYSVQSAVYDRLFGLPESFFHKFDSADLAMRAMGVSSIFEVMAETLVTAVLSGVFSLLYLFRMFRDSSMLSWRALVALVVIMAVIILIGRGQMKHQQRSQELSGKTSSLMYQLISGIAKIRTAGVENRALYEYLKPFTESTAVSKKAARLTLLNETIMLGASTIFSIIIYFAAIRHSAELSIGSFLGFTAAFGGLSQAMLELASAITQTVAVDPVYKRALPILSTMSEFDENVSLPGEIRGDIEINNVTFAYKEEMGAVISGLSLSVKPGEYIGIVGPSGCGKSSLMKLLLGFETPQQGRVFYSGKDIESMDKREFRKKLGVVLQDGGIIPGSIYDNITITAPGATVERVQQVIRDVGLEADINDMPMGLHTMLSEGSGTISGGQRQRILIARAIAGDPNIILFDEATSALDNVTQSLVMQSLGKLSVTRIVIAHRLSTVINCDRIIVMDRGRIAESGTYDELMAQKGMFYELATRQIA